MDNNEYVEAGKYTYGKLNVFSQVDGAKCHVGRFCSIGAGVIFLLGMEHRPDWITTYPFNALMPNKFGDIKGHPYSKGNICVGNDVWIGRGATILSGVTIGNGAVIGAESVVSKDVPPYAIVTGNPAEVKKYRFTPFQIMMLEKMKWWDWPEEKIMDAVPILMSSDIAKLWCFYKGWCDK